jgi:hypothetical protein
MNYTKKPESKIELFRGENPESIVEFYTDKEASKINAIAAIFQSIIGMGEKDCLIIEKKWDKISKKVLREHLV